MKAPKYFIFKIKPVNKGTALELEQIDLEELLEEETMHGHWIDRCIDKNFAPVMHGRWTTTQSSIESGQCHCSVCNTEFYASDLFEVGESCDGIGQALLPNYCPHCGAKMDGD